MSFPRVVVDEWMDAPDLDPERHRQALAGLRRLNAVSGVSRVMYRQLMRLARQSSRPLKVLDVAGGSGDLAIDWMCRARRQKRDLHVTVLDRAEVALEAACQSARRRGVEIGTVQRDCMTERLPTGFDVVTCSLFMHHLDDGQVIRLLHDMWRSSSRSVIVCDLDRSRLNWAIVSTTARLVTRSDVVHYDASASVRGAYTRAEFACLIERAIGIPFPVRRSLPCRFLAVLDQSCETQWASQVQPAISGAIA